MQWNLVLRDRIVDAFFCAVDAFNHDAKWKYVWPHYLLLPSTAMDTFFELTVISILDKARKSTILQSDSGNMQVPSELISIDKDAFLDAQRRPFTLYSATAHLYLAMQYPKSVLESLQSVGVRSLSEAEFLNDLANFVDEDPVAFHNKPFTWFVQLCAVLLTLSKDQGLLKLIKKIPLIPLQDGIWASTTSRRILFPDDQSHQLLPTGINIAVVTFAARDNYTCWQLFSILGVKTWVASEICQLILETHAEPDFDASDFTVHELVSHAVYMFKISWRPHLSTLWFATTCEGRELGEKLYAYGHHVKDTPGGRILAHLESKNLVIHGAYARAFGNSNGWLSWLDDGFGVSRHLRIITPYIRPIPQPTELVRPGALAACYGC
jgi:hypothetical protein